MTSYYETHFSTMGYRNLTKDHHADIIVIVSHIVGDFSGDYHGIIPYHDITTRIGNGNLTITNHGSG